MMGIAPMQVLLSNIFVGVRNGLGPISQDLVSYFCEYLEQNSDKVYSFCKKICYCNL
jgi:hypothetical protein